MKQHKYRAKPVQLDGHTFHSMGEAARYGELKLLENSNQITDLSLQPKFDLHAPDGTKICSWYGDFKYFDVHSRWWVIEDFKGMITPVFRIKWKWVQAEYRNQYQFRLSDTKGKLG